jgi:hypothetical protein
MGKSSLAAGRLLAIGCLAIVCAVILRWGLESQARSKSDRLLDDLKSLQIGQPTADVQAIVQRYGGRKVDSESGLCQNGDSCYEIYSGPPLALSRWLLNRTAFERWAGLRPWEVDVILETRNNGLSQMRLNASALTGRPDEAVQVSTTLIPANALPAYYVIYGHRNGYLEHLRVDITSTATPDERNRAFDFDLSCAGSYVGCRRVCQLAPSIWRAYVQNPTPGGTPITQQEANDPRCKKIESGPNSIKVDKTPVLAVLAGQR